MTGLSLPLYGKGELAVEQELTVNGELLPDRGVHEKGEGDAVESRSVRSAEESQWKSFRPPLIEDLFSSSEMEEK